MSGSPSEQQMLDTLLAALGRAADTDEGRPVVAAHDEDYELNVAGGPSRVVRMRGGQLSVVPTEEGEPGFCAYTRVEVTPAVFPGLVDGSITPTEATDDGGVLMRSRLYGGGQFSQLLRIAQTRRLFAPGA